MRCFFLLTATLFFCAAFAHAADRYWVAAGSSGTWSATSSWSTTTGGSSGAPIPGNGDQAIFDNKKTTPCIFTANVSVSSLTVTTFTGYIDLSTRTLTVQQNFTLNSATFYARTSSITVQGNWSEAPGASFVANTSSVTFSTTTANHLIDSGGDPFYKLIFNGVGGGWTTVNNPVTVSSFTTLLGGSFTIANSSYTNAGDFQVTAGSTLTINNDLGVSGGNLIALTAGVILANSTATLNLSGTGTLGGSTGNMVFPNVSFSGNPQTTTLGSKVAFLGDMTNGAGHTLDAGATNLAITAGGSWFNSGSFTARSASVTFNSSNNEVIQTNGKAFYNVSFNGSGSWVPSGGILTMSSSTYINNGTFEIAASSVTSIGNLYVKSPGTLNIEEDMLVNGGSLINTGTIISGTTQTVTLGGAAGTLGGSGSTTLPALTLAGAFVTTLGGPLTIQGTMTNPAGHTLDHSTFNYSITMLGNWANAGPYTARNSSVTFTGATANGTINTNKVSFYNLVFNGGTWQNITNTITTSSGITINGGTFTIGGTSVTTTGDVDVNAGGTLSIGNDLLINGGDLSNDGTISDIASDTPTVTLSGAGVLGGAGTTNLPKLTLSGAAITTLNGDVVLLGSATINSGHTLDANNTGNYQITISSWFANNGTFTPRQGTVVVDNTATLTGSTTFYDFTAVTPGITLTLQKGTTFSVTDALTLTGAGGNLIGLRSTIGGQYWELNLSGTQAVSFVDAQDSDARSGSIITPSNSTDSGNNRSWNFGDGMVRTWWGSLSTDWSNADNWDSVAPSADDKALIVSTATRMPTLTANVSISTLSITSASSVTLNGFSLSLSSFSNAGIFAFKGNELVVPAPDGISGSTITYNATGGSVPILSTWTYMNLIINGSGGTFTPTGDVSIKQMYTYTAGTLLHTNDEAVNFIGTSGNYNITTGGKPFYNITINGAGGSWTMQDAMTVLSSVTLAAGTLSTKTGSNFALTVGGEWLNSGGTFVANNSSVTFNGLGDNLRVQSGGKNFYNLLFNGAGSWAPSGPITASSDVFVLNGTFQIAGSSLSATGSLRVTSPGVTDIENDLFVAGSSITNTGTIFTNSSTPTVTMSGAGSLGGTGSTELPNLTLAAANKTTTLAGPVTLGGSFTNVANHTLDATVANFGITIDGNWANAGIYSARNSSVTFTGSTSNGTIATNKYFFYNLLFDGGTWQNITNTVTVANNLSINNGSFSVGGSSLTVVGSLDVSSGATLTIDNDVLINGGNLTNGGTITNLTTATVTLNGAGTLGGAGTTTLPKLTLTGAAQTTTLGGDIVLLGSATISAGHTLDANAGGNYQITISSWFADNGIFTPQQGAVVVNSTATLTGSTTFYDFIATTPGITMTFQAGTTQYATDMWTIAGAAGNKIKFRSTGALYTWRVMVSSFVSYVDVQNCVASSQTIYAGQTSANGGSNTNWIFDFPPNAIGTLAAAGLLSGSIQLTWNAPVDNDDNPLGSGSQYVIEWATYTTVAWSTSTVGDTGNTLTSHIFISTSAVSPTSYQTYISTGFGGSTTYYFQIWTKDPSGQWSQGFSNMASTTSVLTIGITLSPISYDFGSVQMGITTVSTSAITITNTGNATETYSLSVATSGASGLWGVQASTPTILNEFVVFGGFNSVVPSSTTFFNVDALTHTPTASTNQIFAINQTGVSVPSSAVRNLWLRLDMPPSTSHIVQQQMTVTISASNP